MQAGRTRLGRRKLMLQSLEDRRLLAANPFPDDYKFDSPAVTDFTIGLWMNSPNEQTTDVAVLSNKNWGGGSNTGYIMTQRGDGAWRLNLNTAGGTRVDSAWTPLDANQWNHLAFSFSRTSGDVNVYTNGALTQTLVQNAPGNGVDTWDASNWYDLNLGQDGTGNYAGGQSFKGLVDDVAIWRQALTGGEIAAIYAGGVAATPQSLSQLITADASLGSQLVGLYDFDGALADRSPTVNAGLTAKDGIYRTTGPAGTEQFVTGLFGQAISLRDLNGDGRGDEFITLGDAVAPADGPDATFTGGSVENNDFATAANWDLAPSEWILPSDPSFQNGTSLFVRGNTSVDSPAALRDGDDFVVENFVFGGGTEPVFIGSSGGSLIGGGNSDSVIGGGADVTLVMTGGEISHYGDVEEGSELRFSGGGGISSNVSVTLGTPGSTEDPVIASGPFVLDPTYATGYRRVLASDGLGDRLGDDIKLGAVNGDNVELVMNGRSLMLAVDVLYPVDQASGTLNVTQNDESEVIVLWDTRWFDSGGSTDADSAVWTLNDSSKYRAGRDHNMGEQPGTGFITLNVSGPGAEFTAGDRIAIGSGGGNVTINVNDGLVKVGGDDPSEVIFVDPTGDPGAGTPPRAVDWVLLMGSNAASSNLNVTGGRVEVGRNAYVGLSDGGTANARVFVDGGVFEVKGVGPSDAGGLAGIGNNTANGTASVLGPWFDSGGDVIIGMSTGDTGEFHYRGGEVSIARDVNVGFGIAGGNEGTGRLVLEGRPGGVIPVNTNAFELGGVLAFGYDFVGGTNLGSGSMKVVLNEQLTPITLTDVNPATEDGNVYIGTGSGFELGLASGYRPATGENVGVIDLIQFNGQILGSAGTFVELPSREASGIDYSLIYDDANDKIQLSLDRVYRPGDVNFDGTLDFLDLAIFSENWLSTDANFAMGDLNGDGVVDFLDLAIFSENWLQNGPAAPPAAPPLPTQDPAAEPMVAMLAVAEENASADPSDREEELAGLVPEELTPIQVRSVARVARSTVVAHDRAVLELSDYDTADDEERYMELFEDVAAQSLA